jgi:transglutaminase-like putative cysteine protease
MVLALLAHPVLAGSGPYWHRSAVLHYVIEPDGRSTVDEVWDVRADTNAVAQTIAQQTYIYSADVETVSLVAAFTRKADGRVIPVSPDSVMNQAVTTTATLPQFDGRTARAIIFPQVRAGDTVHYELRRTVTAPVFPGEAMLSFNGGWAAATDWADITVELPAGKPLMVAASGLVEEAPTFGRDGGPEGGTVRRWTLAPRAAGVVRFEASTFTSYEALGRAYGVGAAAAAQPGPAVRALADSIAPAGLSERETARRLYDFVAGDIRYVATLLGDGRVVPRSAERVLVEGWGDCKDHTALLGALLMAKGIASEPALISSRRRYDLPPVPGLTALNHVITYVPSLDLFLDSTVPYAPFGELPAGEYDKPVVIADARAARLSRTPAMSAGALLLVTRTEVRIDRDGGVNGDTVTNAAGPEASALRSVAAWFERNGGGQTASNRLQSLGTPGRGEYAFDTPDAAAGPYRIEARFVLQDRLAGAGTVPFVVPSGLGVMARPGAVLLEQAATEDGYRVCYPGSESEEIAVAPPREMRIAGVPADVTVAAGGARYTARYSVIGGVLSVRRVFEVVTAHQSCSPEEFELMRPVMMAARLDEQQARLSLIAAAENPRAARRTLLGEGAHHAHQIGFVFETDAREVGHENVAILDADLVGKAAIGLEQVGVALVAAEAEACGDVEGHLVTAMRDAAGGGPAGLVQDFEGAEIFAQTVGQGAVELQPIAVGAHAAMAEQVAGVLMAEEVFAGGHRGGVEFGERGLQRVVQRITGFFIPEERVVAEDLGVGDGGLEVEAAVGVDRELGGPDFGKDGFDAGAVLVDRGAADLHFDDRVAAVEVAAHLGAEGGVVLAGVVVAAGGVDEHSRVGGAAVAVGEQAE